VEIARALATRPKVIFFDEPTEPFQQAEVRKLFDLIKSLRQQGLAIVYVSHRLPEVKELADTISVIRDGQIIDNRPAHAISDAEIVTLIAGRPLGQVFPDKSTTTGDMVLETRGLSGPGFHNVDLPRAPARWSVWRASRARASASSSVRLPASASTLTAR
jgi:ribose transport system ATP-binding protein